MGLALLCGLVACKGDADDSGGEDADSTTGDESGDGDGDGDGTPPGDCSETAPANAYEGSIAELGVPYDARDDDTWASPAGPSGRFGSGPRIVLAANPDGTLDVAWNQFDPINDAVARETYVTHLCRHEGDWHAGWHLDMPSLDRMAGFAKDEAGNFFGATAKFEPEIQYETEPNGLHRDDILQLVRLNPDGNEDFRIDLRTDITNPDATPIYGPLQFGTGVLNVANGQAVLGFASFTEYDANVTSRHQYCNFLTANSETGELVGMWGGSSHCFDQKIVFDGTSFIGSALGDAGFRGIGLSKINESIYNISLGAKGGDMSTGGGYQNTFTRMGDHALGLDGYVQVFATESNAEWMLDTVSGPRNVGFVHLIPGIGAQAPDNQYDVAIVDTGMGNDAAVDFTVEISTYFGNMYEGKNKQIAWLTDYQDGANEHAERPKVVRLADDSYAVLWEKWTADAYVETVATIVDEYGNTLVEKKSLGSARLQRGDSAVALAGKAAWVVGEKEIPQLVLYLLDAQLELERHEIQ
jgi:hypothetical protein